MQIDQLPEEQNAHSWTSEGKARPRAPATRLRASPVTSTQRLFKLPLQRPAMSATQSRYHQLDYVAATLASCGRDARVAPAR
eukprot:6207415-Pleurochrysis_carterae.AAC.1